MSDVEVRDRSTDEAVPLIAPEVLVAANGDSPAAIAEAIAPDVPEWAATPLAVLDAASALEEHSLVTVRRDDNQISRTELGDAVAFVRLSARYTVTLYCHVHYADAVPKRTVDEWLEAIIGGTAASLPDVGDNSVLGEYNPLGEFVDPETWTIRPTAEGRYLAALMHTAWLDVVGRDPAWERAKQEVGRGD